MGYTYADIKLVNADDLGLAKRSMLSENEIKQMTVRALVDTGCITFCINDAIQEVLQLSKKGTRKSVLADGRIVELDVLGPIEIYYLDRYCTTNALLMPGNEEPLLGAIPMEEMDLVVYPARNELRVAHEDGALMKVK
jgi:clan AA aspartic protease